MKPRLEHLELDLDLEHLLRVCLNDPVLRMRIHDALAQDPAPMRAHCGTITDGDASYGIVLRTDRERSPGDPGFIATDAIGWINTRFVEIVRVDHDAATISLETLRERGGGSRS